MAEYPIPGSHYVISNEGVVRNARLNTPVKVTAGGRVSYHDETGKKVNRRPADLLALARDGVPIPMRKCGVREGSEWSEKRKAAAPPKPDSYPIRTITYQQFVAEKLAERDAQNR